MLLQVISVTVSKNTDRLALRCSHAWQVVVAVKLVPQAVALVVNVLIHCDPPFLGNDQDAEDAVHDAFLAIAKNFDKISTDDRHKTKAFVVIVVENKAINIYHHKKRRSRAEYLDDISGIPVHLPDDDGMARCLLKLPARYREFLLLKYEWGYNNRELSALLGISEAGVRKLNQRAKASLEKLCREEGLL